MPYPKLSRRTAFAAVLEATPGAATEPTMADNAIRLMEPPTYEEIYLAENMTDEIITGRLGVLLLAFPGSRAIRIRGRTPLINTGAIPAVGAYPEIDPILVAGGMTRTLDIAVPGSETVSYEPNDDPSVGALSTICAKLQMDGKEYILYHGVLEELTIECDAAGFPVASWALVGIMETPTEQDLVEATTLNNNYFPIWKGANSLTISGVAQSDIFARRLSFNLGLQAVPRIDANSADGHAGYLITGRVPQLDLRVEPVALASWDPRNDWNQRVSRTIVAQFGILQAQYSQIELRIGDARTINVVGADDNQLRYVDINYRATMPLSGTEPEVRLTFM